MNKTILNLFLSCCLILFMASCGSGDGGEDSAPQLSNAILESETLVPSLQIVREGQALPLQFCMFLINLMLTTALISTLISVFILHPSQFSTNSAKNRYS